MGDVTIWHNPRCSKSRSALALLNAAGIAPNIRLYLKDAPSRAEITTLSTKINGGAAAMLRHKEPIAKDMGLTPGTMADDILDALAKHPILIERPIIQIKQQAIIARPPELVTELLKASL